ncbi:MAG: transcriptional regulator [Betaproteobacteria bacterium]|nr:transcriptional regulator [Betaproteobacteria bacterium]
MPSFLLGIASTPGAVRSFANGRQIRRYEAGTAQPTLGALIRLANTLHVRLDDLVFDKTERSPDEEMALLFEAIREFSDEDKQTVRTVLAGMVLQHSARRWNRPPVGAGV